MYQVVALVLTLGLVVLLALGVPVGMALAIADALDFWQMQERSWHGSS